MYIACAQRLQFVSQCVAIVVLVHASAQSVAADILSVPGDFATIQLAVNAASNGDEIVVAPGTYAGFAVTGTKTIRSSGGRDVTILDGGGTAPVCLIDNGSSTITIQGFTITNGLGAGSFGAGGVAFTTFAQSALTTIDDCIFSNNSAAVGGAIGRSLFGDLSVTNCTFTGNSADRGGAIELLTQGGKNLLVSNCIFQNNTASIQGGAINYAGLGFRTVVGCTFDGNTAPNGGAIYASSTTQNVIENCQFMNNTATSGDGGAINVVQTGTITNCMFTNNSAATGSGGGIALLGAGASVTGCTFAGNAADLNGGGAATLQMGTLDNCTFDQNQATGSGGGAWMDGGTATACTITNNSAGGNGAGLFLIGANASGCTLTGNTATGFGGAVHVDSEECTLVNCDMLMNIAGSSGGGVYVKELAIMNLSDSTLCMNVPDQYAFAGALLAMNVFGCDITCPAAGATGACCLPLGECVVTSEENCVAAGGTYQGDGTTCKRVSCPGPTCSADTVTSLTFAPPPDGVVDAADLAFLLGSWGACD